MTDTERFRQEKTEEIRLAVARERRRCKVRISAEVLNFDCFLKTLDPSNPATVEILNEWRIRTECLESIYQEDDA